jgi:pimeloyl-ACP methyl ester carboxylesterase
MAEFYGERDYVPPIGGVLHDSVTLGLADAMEVEAFGVFCFEILSSGNLAPETARENQDQLRRLRDRMPAFGDWQRDRSPTPDRRELDRALERSELASRSYSATARLLLSLAAARDVIEADAAKGDRLQALVSIRPQWLGSPSEFYEADEPAIVFHDGSWECSLTPFHESGKFALKAGAFAVAVIRAAAMPGSINAEQIAEDLRRSAERRARYEPPDFRQLAQLTERDVEGKKGIILFLHGLFSTDAATFDGFIDAWRDEREFLEWSAAAEWGKRCGIEVDDLVSINAKPGGRHFHDAFREVARDDIVIAGWAHDTLTTIRENATQLLRLMDDRLSGTDAPIVLVCHSRGGLVARKLAVLAPQPLRDRLTLCVTFGTPHEGAPFAEHPRSLLGLAAIALLTAETHDGITMTRLLAYVRQERTIRGIEDLAPSSTTRGEFLDTLRTEERAVAGHTRRERQLPILAVGGRSAGAARRSLSWTRRVLALIADFQLKQEHDLVVRLPSSRPDVGFNDVVKGGLGAECDHMSYFSTDQIGQDYFRQVIHAVRDALRFDASVCARVVAAQPKRDQAALQKQRALKRGSFSLKKPRFKG